MSDGLTRRVFLGAAAAAAALPVSMGNAEARNTSDEAGRGPFDTPDVPEEYPRDHVAAETRTGHLRWPAGGVGDLELNVNALPYQADKGVTLELLHEQGVHLANRMDPEGARELAASLERAADDVEAWRAYPPEEWEGIR